MTVLDFAMMVLAGVVVAGAAAATGGGLLIGAAGTGGAAFAAAAFPFFGAGLGLFGIYSRIPCLSLIRGTGV